MRKVVGFSIEEPGLNYLEALSALRREEASNPRKATEVVEILGQQAEGLRRLSRLHDARTMFTRALAASRRNGIGWGEAWALWGLASVLRAEGVPALSACVFRAALSAARKSGDRRCALWSVAELSELDRMAGFLDRALVTHEELKSEFLGIGDWKGVCWATLGIAQMYRLRRDFPRAIAEFLRAQEVSQAVGNLVGASWAIRGQAEVARGIGDYVLAMELAILAHDNFSRVGYRLGAAYARKTQADVLLAAGRLTEALELANTCRAQFVEAGERRGIAFSLLTLGIVWSRLDDPVLAIHYLQQSSGLLMSSSGAEPPAFSPTKELNFLRKKYGSQLFLRLASEHTKIARRDIEGVQRVDVASKIVCTVRGLTRE